MNDGQFRALLKELQGIHRELRLMRSPQQQVDPKTLEKIKGIGPAKAQEIVEAINGTDLL